MKNQMVKSRGFCVKLFLVLCVVLVLSLASTALATDEDIVASGSCGDNLTWTLTEGGTLTISGTGEMNSYPFSVIKDKIIHIVLEDGVTSIGDDAFYSCTSFVSIEISDSVTKIGDRAFYKCTSLVSIEIPDGVTSIGNNAFYGCTSLVSIEIPDSVMSIGDFTFSGCTSLVSIEIPDGVTSIGNSAFSSCAKLMSIEIPDSVTSIDVWAFGNCTSLTSIKISENVTRIGGAAFYNCVCLESVLIPDSVISIGELVFYNCANLTSVKIGKKITQIDSQTFENCSSLTSVEIPNSVTIIEEKAFFGCTNLSSITISNRVKSIGHYAFQNCTSLSTIDIPDSVTEIGWSAFSGCTSLTSVKIGQGVTSISKSTFSHCTSLVSIQIPDNVMSIGDDAFLDCTSLVSIKIPDFVKIIRSFAFNGCTSLGSIILPKSVTNIGIYAFGGCTSLSDVRYGGTEEEWNVIEIDKYNDPLLNATIHFESTDPVQEIIVASGQCGDNLTWTLTEGGTLTISGTGEMYRNPFENYKSLIKNVIIEDGVTNIGGFAFYWCSSLVSIEISNTVTSIGEWAFSRCCNDVFMTFTIPASVSEIGIGAFGYCQQLQDIFVSPDNVVYKDINGILYDKNAYTLIAYPAGRNGEADLIPDSVTCIKDHAFAGSFYLTQVILPDSVISIEQDAFVDCHAMNCIRLSESLKTIGGEAFQQNMALESIIIPASVEYIGEGVFESCDSLAEIYVDPDNSAYCSENGVLFTKDKNVLLAYPLGCEEETYVVPEGVQRIGSGVFSTTFMASDKSIVLITIPASVKEIGSNAFRTCDRLTDVYYGGSESEWNAIWINSGNDPLLNATIHYENTGPVQEIIVASGKCGDNLLWTLTESGKLTISGTGEMYSNPFADYKDLIQTVVIEDGVTSIGESAFFMCTSLVSIEISNSVTRFESDAFSDCKSLVSIKIPNGVKSIGESAFYNCISLISIEIPDSVTSIRNYAFANCTSLKAILVGENNLNYRSIEGVLFNKNASILITCPGGQVGSYVVPNNVRSIGYQAFRGCTGITSIVIPDSVTNIGNDAFIDCTTLTSIEIPKSVTNIGYYAFFNCMSLADVWYGGSEDEWNAIEIANEGNKALMNARLHFVELTYTVTYDANGGVGAPEPQTKLHGQILTLSTMQPTREGFLFLGWAEDPAADEAEYRPGTQFTKDADTMLYAVWQDEAVLPKLVIESVTAAPGEEITVCLSLSGPVEVKSILLDQIIYDHSALTLTGASWTIAGAEIASWNPEEGFAVAAFSENIQLEGVIFTLAFRADEEIEGDFGLSLTAVFKKLNGSEEVTVPVRLEEAVIHITSILRGDINGDGHVTSDDAIFLLRHTLNPIRYPIDQSADFNGDGFVTSDDAIYLLRHTLNPDRYPLH